MSWLSGLLQSAASAIDEYELVSSFKFTHYYIEYSLSVHESLSRLHLTSSISQVAFRLFPEPHTGNQVVKTRSLYKIKSLEEKGNIHSY